MSTANKLTYLNETKQELKQKINNLGGSIDDNTTFRNYANQLQNVYDILPKTEYAEGTEITLSNTLKGKLDFEDGIVGYGDTKQESINGYNVLKLVATTIKSSNTQGTWNNNTYTLYGITFSLDVNSNDVVEKITISGTSTQQATFYLYNNSNYLASGSYLLSGCSNGSNTTYDLRSYNTNNTGEVKQNFTTPISVTSNGETQTINFALVVRSSQTISNAIIYPMLESGTTAHDWEPYTGGQASPNPSYPQEIKYVRGRNIVESKNVKNVTTGYSDTLFVQADLKPSTTYTISFEGVAGNQIYANENLFILEYMTIPSGRASLVVTTKATISKNTRAQYQEENGGWLIFKNNGSGNPTANIFDNLQIEEGTQPTPYLPYNTIEEVVSGKNLFDNIVINKANNIQYEKTETGCKLSAIETSSSVSNLFALFIVGDTNKLDGVRINLDMSVTNLSNKYGFYIGYCDASGNNRVIEASSRTTIVTGHRRATMIVDGTTYANRKVCVVLFGVDGYAPTAGDYTEFDDIVVYTGEQLENISYEPYITPTSYQLSLGDIELCGIGNYKDELIYDVDEDRVYKNEKIGKVVLNGTQNTQYISVTQGSLFRMTLVQSVANIPMYCTAYKGVDKALNRVDNSFYYNQSASGDENRFDFIDNRFTDASDFNNYLSNNNATLYYILRNAVEIPITDTTLVNQVKAWYNAHSLNGTTIITSNGNLPMIIKVRGLKGE